MRQSDGLDLVRTHGPATTTELAAAAGIPRDMMYKCLCKLQRHGEVTKTIAGDADGVTRATWEAVQ